ncbi:hypothetical protein HMPREF1410_01107 [Helicobacter pylori GAM249T]|nr:hypothetical protein HMPREF1410_01107 [Helicobacter pylori GAM249T]
MLSNQATKALFLKNRLKNINFYMLGSQLVVGWVSAFLVETLLIIGRVGFRKI